MLKRFSLLLLVVTLLLTMIPASAEIQYPLDTDVELTIWIEKSSSVNSTIASYDENESFTYAQTDTGIKLKFIHPNNATAEEEFNLMIVSGELPDIIVNPYYMGGGTSGIAAGVEDGIFLDLTDYLKDYSPTYYSYLRDNVEFFQDATTPEGKVYYYTNYKDVSSDEEGSWDRFQVRKDWLEEIGLDTLRTIEDYEKYFQHILDTKEGVTPFTLVSSGIERCFLTAFDLTDTSWYQIDGKLHYVPAEDNFKDYLELMHSWYEKGYISSDFTSYTGERDAFFAGLSGGYCGTSVDAFELASTIGLSIQNCPYMRQYEGQQIYDFYRLRPMNGQYAVITTDCEHIEEAMAFMDYGFTVEGSYTYCYGVPEVAWTYGEDGLPKYTDYILNNPYGYSMTEVSYVLRLHEGFPHMRDADALSVPTNTLNPECLAYRLQWQDDPNCSIERAVYGAASMTSEDAIRYEEIMTEISTYKSEMVLKYITGVESLDTFEEYQQTIMDLGLEEAIELYQKGYDSKTGKKMAE